MKVGARGGYTVDALHQQIKRLLTRQGRKTALPAANARKPSHDARKSPKRT
jgi:hypothetical protein